MEVGRIGDLWIYPVKSMRGESLDCAEAGRWVLESGETRDRQMMVTTSTGEFVTLRTQPRLILITAVVQTGGRLKLSAEGRPPLDLHIPTLLKGAKTLRSAMWGGATIEGLDMGPEVSAWISSFLDAEPGTFKLVYHQLGLHNDRSTALYHKSTPKMLLRPDERFMFNDAVSYHVMCDSSLHTLNAELPEGTPPLSMRNFRPNFTVVGSAPFEEDDWAELKVGLDGPEMTIVKQTDRCLLTTTDMDKGSHRSDGEPVRTLKRTRPGSPQQQKLNKYAPLLGLSLFLDRPGPIHVGDPVFVRYGHPEH